jgi:hypothetical protein
MQAHDVFIYTIDLVFFSRMNLGRTEPQNENFNDFTRPCSSHPSGKEGLGLSIFRMGGMLE